MKLALGTVQFGGAYGAFNADGAIPEKEAARCLDAAAAAGIDLLDTARAYGDSEAVLGRLQAPARFRVVTKIPAFTGSGPGMVARSFSQSLETLGADRVHGLMLHNGGDLLGDDGAAAWRSLESLRDQGLVEKIGVSVYSPGEALQLVERFPVTIMQAPFSVFDQRLKTSGALDRLREQGVEVHVRSVFLQGFALANPDQLPPHLAKHRHVLDRLRTRAKQAGVSALSLALSAAGREEGIDRVVVGVQSLRDLEQIIEAASLPVAAVDIAECASDDITLLNPSLWSKTA